MRKKGGCYGVQFQIFRVRKLTELESDADYPSREKGKMISHDSTRLRGRCLRFKIKGLREVCIYRVLLFLKFKLSLSFFLPEFRIIPRFLKFDIRYD